MSLLLQSDTEEAVTFSDTTTRLMTDFGQFLTHDIIQTPDLAGSGPDPCDCVRTDVCDYVFPRRDPIIPWRCFFIVKSVGRIGRSGPNNVATKEQVNQLTSFIDGTNLYGFTEENLDILRDHGDGQPHRHLFMVDNGEKGPRLPHTRVCNISYVIRIFSR